MHRCRLRHAARASISQSAMVKIRPGFRVSWSWDLVIYAPTNTRQGVRCAQEHIELEFITPVFMGKRGRIVDVLVISPGTHSEHPFELDISVGEHKVSPGDTHHLCKAIAKFHIPTAKPRAYYWNTGREPNCLPFRF